MHVDPTATLERQWTMLGLIPAWPRTITVAALRTAIHGVGFTPSRRTVNRDLQELSNRFPITVDATGKTFRWGWMKSAPLAFLPRLSVAQCLALALARKHMHALPKAVVEELDTLFDAAERELEPTIWKDWHKRIAFAPLTFALLPPTIDAKVVSDAQHALAGRVILTAKYCSIGGKTATQRTIHPLGLLVRDSVHYLVSQLPEYPKPVQLALHRMSDTTITSEPSHEPRGFSMTRYAARNLAINPRGKIRLRAVFDATAAKHLRETRISKYQTWRPIEGTDKVEIRATVEDDLTFKRWLLSFGSEVEVLEPVHLRQEIKEEMQKALRGYC